MKNDSCPVHNCHSLPNFPILLQAIKKSHSPPKVKLWLDNNGRELGSHAPGFIPDIGHLGLGQDSEVSRVLLVHRQ